VPHGLLVWRFALVKDSLVKKSGKVSIMMKNLKKPEEVRKYEAADKSRVLVTWPSVAMYLRASGAVLITALFLCHVLRTSVVVTADFWLAAWSVAVPQNATAAANVTVCKRLRNRNRMKTFTMMTTGTVVLQPLP